MSISHGHTTSPSCKTRRGSVSSPVAQSEIDAHGQALRPLHQDGKSSPKRIIQRLGRGSISDSAEETSSAHQEFVRF